MGLISIILPVTDDASQLDRTVLHTQYEAGLWPTEIIVANMLGDDVAAAARDLGVRVVDCAKADRTDALNCGAAAAKGEILLFLDPHSLVPRRFAESIWRVLRDPRVVGGAFDFEFDSIPAANGLVRPSLAAVRVLNRIRFRWTGNFLIEQGIFIRREVYDKIGGFRPVRRLEDLYFSRSMKRLGRTAVLSPPMQTSARRFLRGGVIRQFLTDMLMLLFDGFGSRSRKTRPKNPGNSSQLITSVDVVNGKD